MSSRRPENLDDSPAAVSSAKSTAVNNPAALTNDQMWLLDSDYLVLAIAKIAQASRGRQTSVDEAYVLAKARSYLTEHRDAEAAFKHLCHMQLEDLAIWAMTFVAGNAAFGDRVFGGN